MNDRIQVELIGGPLDGALADWTPIWAGEVRFRCEGGYGVYRIKPLDLDTLKAHFVKFIVFPEKKQSL